MEDLIKGLDQIVALAIKQVSATTNMNEQNKVIKDIYFVQSKIEEAIKPKEQTKLEVSNDD